MARSNQTNTARIRTPLGAPVLGALTGSAIVALALISLGLLSLERMANAAGRSGATASSLTASRILHRVAIVYATAKTYQDSGVVKGTGGTAVFLSQEPFSTAYQAPDRFRFEFVSMHPVMISPPGLREIIYRHGSDVKQWAFSKFSAPPSLDVAGATGVSSSVAHNIPALLMPHIIGGRKLTNDPSARLLPEAPCDGHTCYRIQETHARTGIMEIIWIDRTSFLIRRIDSHLKLPTSVTSDLSTFYRPVINRPVADSALEFNPPTTASGSRNAS